MNEAGAASLSGDKGGTRPHWLNEIASDLDVDGDREQLFRVFTNLGQNAIQAGAPGVRISAGVRGGRMVIDVADDGPGLLAQGPATTLFQPFAGSSRSGGTGLGLVIVRDIMHAHGGDISLLRSGEGGTTFRLEFPAPRRDG